MLLLCLGVLYSPHHVHHKLFSSPFGSTQIIALFILISPSMLFLRMSQTHCWPFGGGLVALEFLQGEETGSSQFWSIVSRLGSRASGQLNRIFSPLPGQPLGNQITFLPADLPSGRPPLLLSTWEVCHRSGLSLTLLLERWMPQSKTVSLSTIPNWNNSWFSASNAFTLL